MLPLNASLTFLADLPKYSVEKPYEIWRELESGLPHSNCEFEQKDGIQIMDAREHENDLGIDSTGFIFLQSQSSSQLNGNDCLTNNEEKIQKYLNETIDFIKSQLQAHDVICFDWRYRKNTGVNSTGAYDASKPGRNNMLTPAYVVHMDDSFNGGMMRLRRILRPDESDKLDPEKYRTRLLNAEGVLSGCSAWRPLARTVENAPLALCDRQSVQMTDLLEYDKIHLEELNEGYYMKFRQHQKWYWLPQQTRDEIILFKSWDSKKDPEHPGRSIAPEPGEDS